MRPRYRVTVMWLLLFFLIFFCVSGWKDFSASLHVLVASAISGDCVSLCRRCKVFFVIKKSSQCFFSVSVNLNANFARVFLSLRCSADVDDGSSSAVLMLPKNRTRSWREKHEWSSVFSFDNEDKSCQPKGTGASEIFTTREFWERRFCLALLIRERRAFLCHVEHSLYDKSPCH